MIVDSNDRKWIVASYQRIKKDKRAYSVAELVAIKPAPAGRTVNELAEMLDKVVALRRLKKPPARWALAGAIVFQPSEPSAPVVPPDPASQRAKPSESVLAVQRTPRLSFDAGGWKGGTAQLTSGSLSLSWSELLRATTDAMSDAYVDRLTLELLVPRATPVRITMVRGLDPLPFFLAYSTSLSTDRCDDLFKLSWHLWRPESALSYDHPHLALRPPVVETAVATWRSATPLDLSRSVCHALHTLTGTSPPAGRSRGSRRGLSAEGSSKRSKARSVSTLGAPAVAPSLSVDTARPVAIRCATRQVSAAATVRTAGRGLATTGASGSSRPQTYPATTGPAPARSASFAEESARTWPRQ